MCWKNVIIQRKKLKRRKITDSKKLNIIKKQEARGWLSILTGIKVVILFNLPMEDILF